MVDVVGLNPTGQAMAGFGVTSMNITASIANRRANSVGRDTRLLDIINTPFGLNRTRGLAELGNSGDCSTPASHRRIPESKGYKLRRRTAPSIPLRCAG